MDCGTKRDFLELIGNNFSYACGTTPPTSLYLSILKKLNDKYGASFYELDNLRTKYQRMRADYKSYITLLTNIGLGWDEKTKTVTCSAEYLANYKSHNKHADRLITHRLPNYELYKKVYSKSSATSFMATTSGGHRPQPSQVPIDEDSDGDEADTTQLLGLYSGYKRPSTSNYQPKQARKKKGKISSVDETFMNVCTIITDKMTPKPYETDSPASDPFDLLT